MSSVLDNIIEETINTSLWSQERDNWLWDEVYNQISSAHILKKDFKLAEHSYYDIFLQNYLKLSNPNRSGAGIYASISKSQNSSHLSEEVTSSSELDSLKKTFVNMLITKAEDDSDEEAFLFLKQLLKTYHRESVFIWVQKLFNENCDKEIIVLGLLKTFLEFEFEELDPVAVTIAACCKNHMSYAVKSATFSLLGHWCNKQALLIITSFEEPKEMMLRVKYQKLKDIITNKCSI